MNALQQYIDLFRENRKVVEENAAPFLNEWRDAALDVLDGARLPEKGDKGYEKTSIEEMFAPDYGVNIARVNIPVDVAATFKCDVPGVSTLLGVVVNDRFVASRRLASGLPDGVVFTSLRDAAERFPELVGKYYAPMPGNISDSAALALNSLLLQDGVFIYSPDGVELEKPLQLVNIFSAPSPLMAVRTLVIAVGRRASARLLVCDHTQGDATRFLSSQVVHIILEDEARFEMCDIEESSALTSRHSTLVAEQKRGSSLTLNSTTLTCGNTRNDMIVNIMESHCETRIAGMAIGDRKMHIDNNTSVTHFAPKCHSNQLFKYVLDDESTGAFGGTISVTPGAPYTEAYQSNRNLLASGNARMHAEPQLIINNDEVKCSHGATTGQLDSEALFYMRTRGISEKEARTMLMQAFMVDVIDTVHIPGLHDRLLRLVDKRFSGQSGCNDCNTCKEI